MTAFFRRLALLFGGQRAEGGRAGPPQLHRNQSGHRRAVIVVAARTEQEKAPDFPGLFRARRWLLAPSVPSHGITSLSPPSPWPQLLLRTAETAPAAHPAAPSPLPCSRSRNQPNFISGYIASGHCSRYQLAESSTREAALAPSNLAYSYELDGISCTTASTLSRS